jgi:hypothetical protein
MIERKNKKKLAFIIDIYAPKIVERIDGFDNAIIGLQVKTSKLIYSVKKCIKILENKMETEEAVEHFYSEVYKDDESSNGVIFCEDYLTNKPNI